MWLIYNKISNKFWRVGEPFGVSDATKATLLSLSDAQRMIDMSKYMSTTGESKVVMVDVSEGTSDVFDIILKIKDASAILKEGLDDLTIKDNYVTCPHCGVAVPKPYNIFNDVLDGQSVLFECNTCKNPFYSFIEKAYVSYCRKD